MEDEIVEPSEEPEEPSVEGEPTPPAAEDAEPLFTPSASPADDAVASDAVPPEPPAGAGPSLDQAAIDQLLQQQGEPDGATSLDAQPEAGEPDPPAADAAEDGADAAQDVVLPASATSEGQPYVAKATEPSPPTRGEATETTPRLSREEKLDLLVDVPLTITAELGRAVLPIADVLALDHGSVIELDRAPAQPVDLLVNGQLVAKGEVVVVDDNFGIRITSIVNPADSPGGACRDTVD